MPWSERLVEVIADLGPAGYRYGSGCVVVGKTVLTAAHVIAGAVAVTVRDARKRSYSAAVDAAFVGDHDGSGPDLALVLVDELPGEGFPPVGLGRVIRDGQVPLVIERCHAFGYPGFAESSAALPSRDIVQAVGVIAPLSKLTRGLLSMVVSIEPEALSPERVRAGESPWSGMSGGPVVAEERLLGVVVEHSFAEGSSAITVVPLTAVEADPVRPGWGPGVPDPAVWWCRLAVGGSADLHAVPTSPLMSGTVEDRTSAYLAQVARIAPGELLGRTRDLDELAEFCTAPDSGPYLWLRAPAWAGKSALLSWFVLHPPSGVRVVSFFVTARFASQDDRVAFVDAVLEQTLALLGQPVPALLTEATRDAHMLTQLNEAAAVCRARAERLVLVVDGLDEDRGAEGHSIAALLPARPIAGMRVIVASRPNPPLPADVREDHPLHNPATERTLEPSVHAARTRVSTQLELKRLLADQSGDRDLLGFVTAAGGGLTARDLGELTGQQVWQVEDRLRGTAGRTFTTRAGTWQTQETYVLGHEELQSEAAGLLGEESLEAFRRRLHDWADVYERRGWPDDTPDFLLQGYFRLLQATGRLARMVGLVTDPARQARMLVRSGAESAAAAELTMTQDAILAQEPPDLVAMATVAVHRDVMIRRNRNISADLPVLWARLGAYSRAEALAQSINDPEQRAEALQSIAAAASPASSGDPESEPRRSPTAHDSCGVVELTVADSDDLVRQDVEALVSAARSVGGADEASALLDAAEQTAYSARSPAVRASLWNDIVWARGSAAGQNASARPGSSLSETYLRPALDDVVLRALERGDLDCAAGIAHAVHRADPLSRLLTAVVERAAKAGDIDRAGRLALSFPAGHTRTEALNRLVETAVGSDSLEAGSLDALEDIARTLAARGGVPTALILVARAVWDRGEANRAKALLADAFDIASDPSSWEMRAFADAVRIMTEMGDVDQAESAAAACTNQDARSRMLLAVAHAASDRGDDARARTLAAQVFQDAERATAYWSGGETLTDAAGLLARLGEAERAAAAAQTIADTGTQRSMLVRIVEATLEIGDFAAAEATSDLIVHPVARENLLPRFVRAYLHAGDYTAAMSTAQRGSDEDSRTGLITKVVRYALAEGALDTADATVQTVTDHDVQVALRLEVARAAVASAPAARAQALLEATEAAARSAPDAGWRAEALTAAAWALVPHADIERIGILAVAAEDAARRTPDAAPRAAALVGVGAVVAAMGDPRRAERIFEEASHASSIPCAPAEHLATRARAAADRGHHTTARAQVSALGNLLPWIAEPNNRVRAAQAWLAAAIHIGDLDQAEEAARAIEHPDQQPLGLIDVVRARAAAGQARRAVTLALAIENAERRANALSEVARLAAAQGEMDLAEQAARAIAVRGGRSPALLSVVWEATRAGDLARAERIVVSIDDEEWRRLGRQAVQAQRDAPPAVRTRPDPRPGRETASATKDSEPEAQDLLDHADATPDHPSAARFLAEAMRASPCTTTLASLSRVAPPAAFAAADALLTILR